MKLIYVIIPMFCLLFSATLTAQVPGELAIVNSGFEMADLSGWNAWPGDDPKVTIVTDSVYSGAQAARIAGGTGSFYKVVTDEVNLAPGTFYCIVANVRNPSSDSLQEGQSVYLASKVTTPSGDTWFESPKVITSASGTDVWQQLSYGLTYPADATELTVEFKWTGTGADDPGCVYVDDVKIIRMETPEAVINLGFEDAEDSLYTGDGGWWTWAYLPVEPPVGAETWIDDAVSRSGDRALAMVTQDWSQWSDDWWWGGFYCWTGQTLYPPEGRFLEGDNFYMSAWVMTPSQDPLDGPVNVKLELTFKDSAGTNLTNLGYTNGRVWSAALVDETSTMDEWHFLEMFIQMPPVAPEIFVNRIDFNMVLSQYGDAWGTVYVDDVFIAQGKSAPSKVESKQHNLPVDFSLSQNYPNPFNPVTTISYSLDKTQHVRLSVYDVLGKKAAVLENGVRAEGVHKVQFDASHLPGTIYFYRLEADGGVLTRKMLFVK